MIGRWGSFWKTDLTTAPTPLRQSILSHLITAKHAAPLMIKKRRGSIVEVTEGDRSSAAAATPFRRREGSLKGFARAWRASCGRIASPRSRLRRAFCARNRCSQHFGVTEANWRDGGKKDRTSSSPSRRCLSAGPSPRWPAIRMLERIRRRPQLVGAGARAMASPTTTAGAPTGAGTSARLLPSIGFVEPFRRHRAFLERMMRRMDRLPRGGRRGADRRSGGAAKSSRRK